MKIISVDPGQTTGIAIAEWDEVSRPTIRKQLSVNEMQACSAVLGEGADVVVIERPPSRAGNVNLAFDTTIRDLNALSGATRLVIFSPGDWKPFARSQDWDKSAPGSDQHQKDAYNLLRYYFVREHHAWVKEVQR